MKGPGRGEEQGLPGDQQGGMLTSPAAGGGVGGQGRKAWLNLHSIN